MCYDERVQQAPLGLSGIAAMAYEPLLQQLGMSKNEAVVYEALLSLGKATAGELLRKVPLKRGNLYNVLYSLRDRGLIIERKEEKKKLFEILHPQELEAVLEKQRRSLQHAEEGLHAALPFLVSSWRLALHKPNVQFFEGEEGMRRVLEDSLEAHDEILQYSDPETIDRYIPKVNKAYMRQRIQRGIKKRLLVPATVRSERFTERGPSYAKLTEIRMLEGVTTLFETVTLIYGEKISYLTLHPQAMVGIIIEDERITKSSRALFEYLWETATPLPAS
jgi:sugar-specific transcriptional regulator TrmB